MADEQFIGPHSYRIDGKLVRLTPRGTLTVPNAQVISQVYERQIANYGRLLVLVDLRHSGVRASPEARRYLVDWLKATGNASRMVGAAFGGGPIQNAMVTLMISAARIVTTHAPKMKFFAEQADAFAWLVEQEPSLATDQAPSAK